MCVVAPLLSVKKGEDVFARHEALLHVAQLQVVHLEHVLLLFLLQGERKRRAGFKLGIRENPFYVFIFGSGFSWLIGTLKDSYWCCFMITLCSSLQEVTLYIFSTCKKGE